MLEFGAEGKTRPLIDRDLVLDEATEKALVQFGWIKPETGSSLRFVLRQPASQPPDQRMRTRPMEAVLEIKIVGFEVVFEQARRRQETRRNRQTEKRAIIIKL